MSNSYQDDEISSIAGEPAKNSPLKSVPPLDGRAIDEQMENYGLIVLPAPQQKNCV